MPPMIVVVTAVHTIGSGTGSPYVYGIIVLVFVCVCVSRSVSVGSFVCELSFEIEPPVLENEIEPETVASFVTETDLDSESVTVSVHDSELEFVCSLVIDSEPERESEYERDSDSVKDGVSDEEAVFADSVTTAEILPESVWSSVDVSVNVLERVEVCVSDCGVRLNVSVMSSVGLLLGVLESVSEVETDSEIAGLKLSEGRLSVREGDSDMVELP
jgi:hypothetical protein